MCHGGAVRGERIRNPRILEHSQPASKQALQGSACEQARVHQLKHTAMEMRNKNEVNNP